MKSRFISIVQLVALLGMTILAVQASNQTDPKKKVCRAIALSGGGSKGAYEAGAFWGLYNAVQDKTSMEYDVATGVSAGSINAAGIAMFEKGDEANLAEFLSDAWKNLTTIQVWKQWPYGIPEGIFEESGALDDSPLFTYLSNFKSYLPIKRKYAISAVDVDSGNYIKFYENTTHVFEKQIKEILSSAAMPIIFPSQNWNEYHYSLVDGGTLYGLNLVSAVQRCREEVDDDSQIVLDVVTCDPYPKSQWNVSENALKNYWRQHQMKGQAKSKANFEKFLKAYPDVKVRYAVFPSEMPYGGLDLLNFENATHTWFLQELGRKDAANHVKLGESWFSDTLKEYYDDNELQKTFADPFDFVHYAKYRDLKVIEEKEKAEKETGDSAEPMVETPSSKDSLEFLQK